MIAKTIIKLLSIKLSKNQELQFDDSLNYLDIANSYKDDPVTLVYLVNYLTKRYTLNRVVTLITNSEYVENKNTFFSCIEALPTCFIELLLQHRKPKLAQNHLHLIKSSLLPWILKKSSMIKCFDFIGTEDNPWEYDAINHRAQFIFPMCCSLVFGGNHSITTGILKNIDKEVSNSEYLDYSDIYEKTKIAYSFGFFYIINKFGFPIRITRVNPNEQITGVIFEIGRMIHNTGFTYEDYIVKYVNNYNPEQSKIADLFLDLKPKTINLLLKISVLKHSDYNI